MINRLNESLLGLAFIGTAVLSASPAMAQIFELGEQVELDLRQNRNPELRPSISTDGNQLNIQIEERPQPETRFRFDGDRIELRQERPEPRERFNLTVPIEAE